MSALDAVANVLGAAGEPLRVDEITARVLAGGQWVSKGKTPAATIEAQLAMEIKNHGDQSRFVRPAPRTYGVRDWPKQTLALPASPETHSFTDAAEAILAAADTREPMHYRQLTERALAAGMLTSEYPARTLP